jgi:presequence protease
MHTHTLSLCCDKLAGIVFNEMKGALESQDSLFYTRAQQYLFPGTTYEHISGGDPLAILDLTHAQLVAFHLHCYHPSNARFVTYGDLPLAHHLELIDGIALSHFVRAAPTAPVTVPARWSAPREKTDTYAPSSLPVHVDKQTTVSLSFLTRTIPSPYETLLGRLVSTLLLDGPTTPMYKALIASGLGADYSANSGFDAHTKQPSFGVGLKVCVRVCVCVCVCVYIYIFMYI